jgi:hypothetical protein
MGFTVNAKIWFQGLFSCMSGKGLPQLLVRKFSLHFKSRAKKGKEAREKSVVCIVNDPLSYVGILGRHLRCKKRLAIFPSPAGMSLTKLSLGGNNYIIPRVW